MNEQHKNTDSIMVWKQYSAPSLFSASFIETYDWVLYVPEESEFVIQALKRRNFYIRSQPVVGNYKGKRVNGYAVAIRERI